MNSENDYTSGMGFDAGQLSEDQQHQLLFMMLVQQHQQIAMMGMGKLKNPGTDKIERDMSSAKYAIDTLNMLKKYTEGHLPHELKDYLDQTISTLQLNYVDEVEKDKKEKAAAPAEEPKETENKDEEKES